MKEYLGKSFGSMYRKIQSYWMIALQDSDITTAEFPVFIILNKEDGITQDEIAKKVGVDKSAITRLIKSLLEKGYIERRKAEDDLRCNQIFLTEKSHESWELIKQSIDNCHSILSNGISEEELNTFSRILSKMQTNMEDYLKQQ